MIFFVILSAPAFQLQMKFIRKLKNLKLSNRFFTGDEFPWCLPFLLPVPISCICFTEQITISVQSTLMLAHLMYGHSLILLFWQVSRVGRAYCWFDVLQLRYHPPKILYSMLDERKLFLAFKSLEMELDQYWLEKSCLKIGTTNPLLASISIERQHISLL